MMEGCGTSQEEGVIGGSGTSQEECMMEGCTNPSFSKASSTEFMTHKPLVSVGPSSSIDLDPAIRFQADIFKEILNMPEADLVQNLFPGQTVQQRHDQRPEHAPQGMGSSQPPQAQQTSDVGMDMSQVCDTNTQGG